MLNRRKQGNYAEDRAASYLQQHGYKVIKRNYYCRYGEIDIVCHKGAVLVFCEVRYRSNNTYSDAYGSVTAQKQQRIIKTASYFLNEFGEYSDHEVRFDIVGINGQLDNDIEWLRAAFTQ